MSASSMPLHVDRLQQALERGLEGVHPDERQDARRSSTCGSRALDEIRQPLGVDARRAEHATGRSRKRASSASTVEEGVDQPRGEAVADHDAVDIAGVEVARARSRSLSAPITPMRSPTATLSAG